MTGVQTCALPIFHTCGLRRWELKQFSQSVIILLVLILLARRRTQRWADGRADPADETRWPEVQADHQEEKARPRRLNPLGTRPSGGAGIGMSVVDDEDFEDDIAGCGEGLGVAVLGTTYYRRKSSYLLPSRPY